ncbi:MAG: hypothetical protein NUW01_09965 [Gemmatimonadaceae bacterium]|nr:hypothetical protein [Gemmatimonadaceae bacterium]
MKLVLKNDILARDPPVFELPKVTASLYANEDSAYVSVTLIDTTPAQLHDAIGCTMREALAWALAFIEEPEWFPNEGDRQAWQEKRRAYFAMLPASVHAQVDAYSGADVEPEAAHVHGPCAKPHPDSI